MASDAALLAITGGPCGGKSTTLVSSCEWFTDKNFDVYVAEEAATRLIEQGMQLKDAVHAQRWNDVYEFQKEIMGCQFETENRLLRCAYRASARTGRKAIVFCDRGLPDNRAYFPADEANFAIYQEILREATGLDHHKALDRYAGVIHLVTAADGARAFYTLENNAARDETPEEAIRLDRRTQEAWLGHQHLAVIDNSTDFEGKKSRARRAMCRILGIPEPLEIERKYKVAFPCFAHFPVPYAKTMIEQTYLTMPYPTDEMRVRRRTVGDSSTYYLTKKTQVRPGVRHETERVIDWREYAALLESRDQVRNTIRKDRCSFLWENQYFELDIFKNLDEALCLLEIELTDIQQTPAFPPFLSVSEKDEVTDDPKYKNHNLALRAKKTA